MKSFLYHLLKVVYQAPGFMLLAILGLLIGAGMPVQAEQTIDNINGTLQPTSYGIQLDLSGDIIENSGGTIDASNGGVLFNSTAVEGGIIEGSTVDVTGTDELDGVTEGSLTIEAGGELTNQGGVASVLTLTGTVNNDGSIDDDHGGGPLSIVIGDGTNNSATIGGSGTVTLTQSASTISGTNGSAALTIGQSQTVENSTSSPVAIGNLGMLVNEGTLINPKFVNITALNNQGTLEMGSGSLASANLGSVTNSGTIEAIFSGTIDLTGQTIRNSGGTIETSNATVVYDNTTISGGTINGSDNNTTLEGTNKLDGATEGPVVINGYLVNNNNAATSTLELTGTVNNNGSIDDSYGGGPIKVVIGDGTTDSATIGGDGTVNLTKSASTISGTNSSAALTIGQSQTVKNSSGGSFTFEDLAVDNEGTLINPKFVNMTALNNQGTLETNSGSLNSADLSFITNSGTIEAIFSGTVDLTGQTIRNSGGTIESSNATVVYDNTTISGGTINGSDNNTTLEGANKLDGATEGPIVINGYLVNNNNPAASTLTLTGTVNNNGSIDDNHGGGALSIVIGDGTNNSATIGGSGTVTLTQSASTISGTNGSAELTIGQSQTVENSASSPVAIENLAMLVNEGTLINPELVNVTALTNQGTLEVSSTTLASEALSFITNSGTIEAIFNGTIDLTGQTIRNSGGTIETSNASVVYDNTTISGGTINGSDNNTTLEGTNRLDGATEGPVVISGYLVNNNNAATSTLELTGTVNNNGSIDDSYGGGPIGVVIGDGTTDSATIGGSGTVNLTKSASTISGYDGSSVLTIGQNQTVRNSSGGSFTFEDLAVDNEGTLVNPKFVNMTVLNNQGTLETNSGSLNSADLSFITNSGTIEAIFNGTVDLTGQTIRNSGGTIESSNATVVYDNTTISGGTINGSDNNTTLEGANKLDGATDGPIVINGYLVNNNNPAASTLTLTGTVNNNYLIADNYGGGPIGVVIGDGTTNSATIGGSGTVNLTKSASTISGYNSSSILTIGQGQAVENSNGGSLTFENLTVVDEGSVNSPITLDNVTLAIQGPTLFVNITASGGSDTIQNNDSAALNVPSAITITGGTVLDFKDNGNGTTVSGGIGESGGSGAVTVLSGNVSLTGPNTYTGATTVMGGMLIVSSSISGTAATNVTNATLAGTSYIANSVTVGNGLGAAGSAVIEPGSPGAVGTLTIGGALTLKSDGRFFFNFDSTGGGQGNGASELVAASVSLDAASRFSFNDVAATPIGLALGTEFTAIDTTGGISGTFLDLPNGSLLTEGPNTFKITYSTDGVFLTVVPEPATWGMLISGLGMLLGVRKRVVL